MKNLFKVVAVALVVAFAAPSVKAERVPMPLDKMPSQITLFLNDYYPGVKVEGSWAKMMRPTTKPMWYRVNLENGTKLSFTIDGNWYSVNAKKSKTPAPIDLLPNEPRKYITEHFPDAKIKSIKWEKDMYRVKLSNGAKLTFDKEYEFVKESK